MDQRQTHVGMGAFYRIT